MSVNEIPYGHYCYCEKTLCPYFKFLDEGKVKCTYLNIDDDDDWMLIEKIKLCGVNELDEEYEKDFELSSDLK